MLTLPQARATPWEVIVNPRARPGKLASMAKKTKMLYIPSLRTRLRRGKRR